VRLAVALGAQYPASVDQRAQYPAAVADSPRTILMPAEAPMRLAPA
jgi:hypothetical protein